MIQMTFQLTDLDKLSMEQIGAILACSASLETGSVDCSSWMKGRILCPLFLQDSSRTYLNSSTSFMRMGGLVVPLNVANTRLGSAWSEPIRDFCTLINACCDLVILRVPAASMLTEFSQWLNVPLINAGNGIGAGSEHPMQALIDLYVIRSLVKPEKVRVLMIGGVHVRTTRSQAKLFHRAGFDLDVIAPPTPTANDDMQEFYAQHTTAHADVRNLDLSKFDVIYHNGMDEDETVLTNERYNLNTTILRAGGFRGKVMHSLPRLKELDHDVDDTDYNLYYSQMQKSRYVFQSVFQFLCRDVNQGGTLALQ